MLEVGIKGLQTEKVVFEKTAAAVGSGLVEVYATPSMIALMEKTASESIRPYLAEGEGSVGTEVSIKHVGATPLNMEVRCESELIEIDRRRLVFTVKAYDEEKLIGEGTHERFIINTEKFLAKIGAK